MLRRLLTAGFALGTLLAAAAPVTQARPMPLTSSPLADPQHDCLEPVPESISLTGVTDDGQNIDLHTMVLLDGIRKKLGKKIMTGAQESYEALALTIVPQFRKVAFEGGGTEPGMDDEPGPTGDTSMLIDQSKEFLGGGRPEGIDLVLLLTNKDLYYMDGEERQYFVAGMADCIGGVRFDDHAFAVGEGISPYTESSGDETFVNVVAAHELAHLLGAHHHYGNCAQGEDEGRPCTIMFPGRIDMGSPNFGTLEAATVRGHAVDHANSDLRR